MTANSWTGSHGASGNIGCRSEASAAAPQVRRSFWQHSPRRLVTLIGSGKPWPGFTHFDPAGLYITLPKVCSTVNWDLCWRASNANMQCVRSFLSISMTLLGARAVEKFNFQLEIQRKHPVPLLCRPVLEHERKARPRLPRTNVQVNPWCRNCTLCKTLHGVC